MGKVLVTGRVENRDALFEVGDAPVDAGAFGLPMVVRPVQGPARTRMARAAGGVIPIATGRAARRTTRGRGSIGDAAGMDDRRPVMIGRPPPGAMGRVVDGEGHRPIGNPEHGGEERVDILRTNEHPGPP